MESMLLSELLFDLFDVRQVYNVLEVVLRFLTPLFFDVSPLVEELFTVVTTNV